MLATRGTTGGSSTFLTLYLLPPAEATAVLFSASSPSFSVSVNTITDKPLHLEEDFA